MSWDIYGNHLRRGHCEVHPHVHEEYPCSICMAQKQQQSQPHNELEQLQYEFAQQGDYIRHLESERAALAAQVDSLLDNCKAFVKKEFELLKEVERLEIELKKRDEQNAALAAQVKELKSELRQEKLIHIGFTNESQVQYVTEDKDEGAFYPNSDHGCYIPVYMLNVHAHRVGSESKIYCTQLEQGKKIAELRAEAVKEFIEFMYKSKHCQLCSESLDKANQYAEQIRQEGK